ncbi:energy-coupling factor ABC transporter permease [Phosphitispora sp. TUW77]|uniref:energy-coupling factor ABC transporter permease n=1 Tax=Phosphitispora sp. TUW77 TaxID=3152361 RepID=UPI003AB6D9A5
MHIPDGFLDTKMIAATVATSVPLIGVAVSKTRSVFDDRQIPKMSVMAAFIFAAQMVNFPIAGGTSGHLLGAALAAILLGPWSAVLIMTTVLIIQCLVFLDGGLTALGGNILLMGIVAPWVGWWVYKLVAGNSTDRTRTLGATFLASWVSTVAASVAGTLLIVFSGYIALNIALPAMLGWHMLIGIGEGLITSVVVAYLAQVKSELVFQNQKA